MFKPENEMGVVAIFSMECQSNGWELLKIGTSFPDAKVKDTETGKEYRAEFEFISSNFLLHGHDPEKCDLIICWKNDISEIKFPVLELSNWNKSQIYDLTEQEKREFYLIVSNRKLQNRINELTSRIDELENEKKRYKFPGIAKVFSCSTCGFEAKSQHALNGHRLKHRAKPTL